MAVKKENDQAVSAKTLAAVKSLRTNIDKLDLQIVKLVNERAGLAAEIGKLQERARHGSLFRGARRGSYQERPPGQQGAARRADRPGGLPGNHQRLAGLAKGSQGRLSGA